MKIFKINSGFVTERRSEIRSRYFFQKTVKFLDSNILHCSKAIDGHDLFFMRFSRVQKPMWISPPMDYPCRQSARTQRQNTATSLLSRRDGDIRYRMRICTLCFIRINSISRFRYENPRQCRCSYPGHVPCFPTTQDTRMLCNFGISCAKDDNRTRDVVGKS